MRPSSRLMFLVLALGLAACASPPPKPAAPPPAASAKAPPPVARPAAPVAMPAKPMPPPPATPQPGPSPASLAAPPGATLVGLLLPLSGPSAALGNALSNAAQMALFETADPELTLLLFDSKGTEEGARAAIRAAIDQHVEVIIGPLFAAELRAVAPLAASARLSVLSFSADRSAAGQGSYVMGFLPGPQALAVADYAASQGKLRQAVLAPANDYGRRVVLELKQGAEPLGVTIGPIEYYDPAALDLSPAIKHLLAGRHGDDPGFDALLLPDDGARLRRAGEQWQAAWQGVDRVTLLGTMLWEDSHPGEQPALAGGWYAAAPAPSFTDFARRYDKAFGAPPPRLASLGYDAAALVMVLNKRAIHDFSVGSLTNPQGFAGIDGLFRLMPDGTIDRAYAIKEVVPNGAARVIQPAPTRFNGS